jgi:energy-coupling factor transport system ATP-binding protein
LGLPREEIRGRVDEALDLLKISHLRERSPHELSSGQQQKVAIASILAMRPRVLILDEPTSQLDPRSSVDIINFVKDLNRDEGITVVLAEHRLESAAPHADKVVVIDKGGIYACGPPREVLDNDHLPEIGVSIPKIVQLAKALKEKGAPLKKLPLTVDEAVDMLEEMIR